ncbi:hypothetical protein [Desulfosporosinus meridiei]|nr:hypothetical protein [Desulfosporosinus meridiei]
MKRITVVVSTGEGLYEPETKLSYYDALTSSIKESVGLKVLLSKVIFSKD